MLCVLQCVAVFGIRAQIFEKSGANGCCTGQCGHGVFLCMSVRLGCSVSGLGYISHMRKVCLYE